MSTRYDIGLVTEDSRLVQRIEEMVKEFGYTYKCYANIEEFLDATFEQSILIAFVRDPKNPNIAAELAQTAKQVDPGSFVICGVLKSLPKEAATFAKKSGADIILLEDELFTSSKLEFAITQALRASYLPLKGSDIIPGKELPFDIYHLMPQRRKFVKFLFKGVVPDDSKIQKVLEVGEVYVHRSKTHLYKKYIEELNDRSRAGLSRRCRAQFLALYSQYSNLVLTLTDQTERTSFAEGEKLLASVRALCQDLLATLAEFSAAWEIINNSTVGEFGSVERAPAVAAYASVFSLQCGLLKIDDIMLVALLIDLGLVFLHPDITKKIREDRFNELTSSQLEEYKSYPQQSLNVVLDRKIAMTEKMRNMLISVHERSNGKGFPKGSFADKIPIESQMIQFCKEFDSRTVVRLGKPRVEPLKVRDDLVIEESKKMDRFTETFLGALTKGFRE